VAEEALRENEIRFRSMADAAPVLIWVSGRDKLCTWFNRQWLEFVGRTMEEEIGNGWAENVHPEDYQECLDTYVASFDARRPFTMVYRLRRHDGAWRWLLDNGIPRHNADGQFAGYIGSCVDVTPQREAEDKLREADRRKDEFLAVLSHELRNPLAPITMAADLLRKKPARDAEESALHDVLVRQTAQLTRLLDDLLDVNRIRSGKIALRRQAMDLNEAVARAVESVAPQFVSKKQDLTIDIPREPIFVDADPTRMSQVTANLLSNASKFTPARGRIALSLARKDGHALLRVKDSGIGISKEQVPHIFEMFAQVEPTQIKTEGGLGVGLALTRMLIDLHGGNIEVKSEGAGRGTEFSVRLPAIAPSATATTAPLPRATDLHPHYRVLVADDNVDSALMLSEALRGMGHDVRAVHDGLATIAAAESFAPQVAFLDIGMPRMNGYDAGKKLREEFGDRIMLVAVTGWGQESDRRRAKEASFDHHLTKPVDLRAIEKILEHVSPNSHA
jgi:PAS domain S-box-containing protein